MINRVIFPKPECTYSLTSHPYALIHVPRCTTRVFCPHHSQQQKDQQHEEHDDDDDDDNNNKPDHEPSPQRYTLRQHPELQSDFTYAHWIPFCRSRPRHNTHYAASSATSVAPARYVIVYAHPNAVDIGTMYDELEYLSDLTQMHVLGFEYRGYGLCSGDTAAAGGAEQCTPEEEEINVDMDAAYDYVRCVLGVPAERIILIGRSIGTGPTARLASELVGKHGHGHSHSHSSEGQPLAPCRCDMTPPALLVLEAPFTSVKDTVKTLAAFYAPTLGSGLGAFAASMVANRFDTRAIIGRVECPILLVHGQKDEIVAYDHSLKLLEQIQRSARARGRRLQRQREKEKQQGQKQHAKDGEEEDSEDPINRQSSSPSATFQKQGGKEGVMVTRVLTTPIIPPTTATAASSAAADASSSSSSAAASNGVEAVLVTLAEKGHNDIPVRTVAAHIIEMTSQRENHQRSELKRRKQQQQQQQEQEVEEEERQLDRTFAPVLARHLFASGSLGDTALVDVLRAHKSLRGLYEAAVHAPMRQQGLEWCLRRSNACLLAQLGFIAWLCCAIVVWKRKLYRWKYEYARLRDERSRRLRQQQQRAGGTATAAAFIGPITGAVASATSAVVSGVSSVLSSGASSSSPCLSAATQDGAEDGRQNSEEGEDEFDASKPFALPISREAFLEQCLAAWGSPMSAYLVALPQGDEGGEPQFALQWFGVRFALAQHHGGGFWAARLPKQQAAIEPDAFCDLFERIAGVDGFRFQRPPGEEGPGARARSYQLPVAALPLPQRLLRLSERLLDMGLEAGDAACKPVMAQLSARAVNMVQVEMERCFAMLPRELWSGGRQSVLGGVWNSSVVRDVEASEHTASQQSTLAHAPAAATAAKKSKKGTVAAPPCSGALPVAFDPLAYHREYQRVAAACLEGTDSDAAGQQQLSGGAAAAEASCRARFRRLRAFTHSFDASKDVPWYGVLAATSSVLSRTGWVSSSPREPPQQEQPQQDHDETKAQAQAQGDEATAATTQPPSDTEPAPSFDTVTDDPSWALAQLALGHVAQQSQDDGSCCSSLEVVVADGHPREHQSDDATAPFYVAGVDGVCRHTVLNAAACKTVYATCGVGQQGQRVPLCTVLSHLGSTVPVVAQQHTAVAATQQQERRHRHHRHHRHDHHQHQQHHTAKKRSTAPKASDKDCIIS